MIRYHSFYPCVSLFFPTLHRRCSHHVLSPRWHREGAYAHLTNEKDKRHLEAVRAFNPYDLYSKDDEPVNVEALRPYYQRLIAKFFPAELDW